MDDFFFYFFTIILVLVPFLYRKIRTGSLSFITHSTDFGPDLNYQKAEKVRIIQVLIGSIYLVFHGSLFWGWLNIFLFIVTTFFISLVLEIAGSKTGMLFGGEYRYNFKLTPGPVIFNIPIVIPIAWVLITYMSFNLYCFINNFKPEILINTDTSIYIIPSLMTMFLDLVLDPIAVNEQRWSWRKKGLYYGVPLLNFSGWFITSFLIYFIFSKFSFSTLEFKNSTKLISYAPGIVFIFIHLIASRPCFERNLKIPGILGLVLSLFYLLVIIL